jgi:secondary thiamine-phosphate synthase enzyme
MVITENISIGTHGKTDIIDITDQVSEKVAESNLTDGTVTVFVSGSTAGVTTIEYEPGLVSDFKRLWSDIAPDNIHYEHNERWGDGNGYSHVRASLLGASLTVPFRRKNLLLGTWQQIIIVDFDNRARQRNIILQIMGE